MSFISPGNNFLHGRTTLHNLSLHESLNQPRAPIKWQCFSPFLKKKDNISIWQLEKTRDSKFHWFMASLHCKCLSVNNYLTFVVALENIRIITVSKGEFNLFFPSHYQNAPYKLAFYTHRMNRYQCMLSGACKFNVYF